MATRYELFTVKEDKQGTPRFTRVGIMWPAREGKDGFSITLEALPLPDEKGEVRMLARPPRERTDEAPKGKFKPALKVVDEVDDELAF